MQKNILVIGGGSLIGKEVISLIQKAGDIIPDIVKTLIKLRSGKEKKFIFPKFCPSCHSPVTKKDGEVAYYCSNKKCYGQNVEAIIHFVSKKGFNIDGLGNSIVKQFVDQSLVVSPADIFSLKIGDLEPLEGFAQKKSAKLLEAIESSKKVDLSNFIYALGIRHVGEETSLLLANYYTNLDKFRQADFDELQAINDVGPEVAKSIIDWLDDNQELLDNFLEQSIDIKNPKILNSKLAGQTFLFTGSLATDRDSAKNKVRNLGGKVVSSVSKKLDYLVFGDKPGSKLAKAKKLAIKNIINEQEFLKLIK